MADQKPIEQQTVKALAWQLLYGNYANKLGPDGWKKLAEETGAPDFRHLDPDEDCPMAPFNAAVQYIDRVAGKGDGALIGEMTRASVVGWARLEKNLVNQLQSRPQKMLEIFCTEVHPYFLNDAGASAIVKSAPNEFILRLDNGLPEEFKIGLIEGYVEIAGAKPFVSKNADGTYRVRWEVLPAAPPPSRFALLINATRAPFLTAAAVPVLLGTAVAWKDGFLSFPLFLLTFIGALAFHVGTNVINDYFDHTSGADEANFTPTPFGGGSRVIQRGLMTPRGVFALASASYALGIIIGLYLAATRGVEILVIGAVGLLISIIYTAPPIRLAHRGVGELAVALGFGPVIVVGAYFVQTQRLSLEALYASIPVALLIAAVLYINEFPDRPWDARAGKKTLVVRLPINAAIDGYLALIGATYAVIALGVALRVLPLATLIALFTIPLAWSAIKVLRQNYAFPYRLIPANANTIFVHLLTGLLLFYGYVVAGLMA
jgi:1,4-dihydroxy-2-naphthoate octaprenyltransferase